MKEGEGRGDGCEGDDNGSRDAVGAEDNVILRSGVNRI